MANSLFEPQLLVLILLGSRFVVTVHDPFRYVGGHLLVLFEVQLLVLRSMYVCTCTYIFRRFSTYICVFIR
jgi:hypothetical protein